MTSTTERSVWHLARLAGCSNPDTPESPGARFLRAVDAGAIELAESHEPDGLGEPSDDVHELADSAVPIYTHERWQTFTDLAAYQEDVTEYGEIADLTAAAGVALYMIADRLAFAILAEIQNAEIEAGA